MATNEPRVNLYRGKWYKAFSEEKRAVQEDLVKNSLTGDTWEWVDSKGNVWMGT